MISVQFLECPGNTSRCHLEYKLQITTLIPWYSPMTLVARIGINFPIRNFLVGETVKFFFKNSHPSATYIASWGHS